MHWWTLSPEEWTAIRLSLRVSLVAMLASLPPGILIALALARGRFWGKSVLNGIVYATDAAADPGVKVVGTFPEDSHPPIIYPVAVLSEAKSPAAKSYLDFLKSEKAAPYFEKQGFTVLK